MPTPKEIANKKYQTILVIISIIGFLGTLVYFGYANLILFIIALFVVLPALSGPYRAR